MYNNIAKTLFVLLLAAMAGSCGNRHDKPAQPTEDLTAKKNLQGIWLDEDGEDVAFRVKGDSVYFPDSTSVPTYFRIEDNSFVLIGGKTTKYTIVKQTPNVFVFRNQSGERVKLYKTNDASYMDAFVPKTVLDINQKKVVKRDSVIYFNNEKYHCYIQINPTTYRVIKPSVNDDGVEIDNVYYDNIVNLAVYNGNRRLYSSDLRKEAFMNEVPEQFLKQAVFSDLYFDRVDNEGIHFFSILAIPETSISYMVESIVKFNGSLTKRIKK